MSLLLNCAINQSSLFGRINKLRIEFTLTHVCAIKPEPEEMSLPNHQSGFPGINHLNITAEVDDRRQTVVRFHQLLFKQSEIDHCWSNIWNLQISYKTTLNLNTET